jgi:hypothetical protein
MLKWQGKKVFPGANKTGRGQIQRLLYASCFFMADRVFIVKYILIVIMIFNVNNANRVVLEFSKVWLKLKFKCQKSVKH